MSEENLEILYQIRSELPVLRDLETRRNVGSLTPEEEAQVREENKWTEDLWIILLSYYIKY